MLPSQYDRYLRQIRLREIGAKGQALLLDARVTPSASGPVGEIEALYLARAGVSVVPRREPAAAQLEPFPHREHFHSAGPAELAEGAWRALVTLRALLEGRGS